MFREAIVCFYLPNICLLHFGVFFVCICVCLCEQVHEFHTVQLKVRGYFMEATSLVLLCGFQGLNSGHWGSLRMLWSPLASSAVTDTRSSSTKQSLTHLFLPETEPWYSRNELEILLFFCASETINHKNPNCSHITETHPLYPSSLFTKTCRWRLLHLCRSTGLLPILWVDPH